MAHQPQSGASGRAHPGMDDPTQSWAERTVEMPPKENPFRRGVASVSAPTPRTEPFPVASPDGPDWVEEPVPRMPPGYHLQQLRIGAHWSLLGGLFAFVCWGIWAISARGDLTSPVVTFVLTLFVAAGLFALCRLLGWVILERQFGRIRRGARAAHAVTGLFLGGVGVAYLRQTEWVMDLWSWLVA